MRKLSAALLFFTVFSTAAMAQTVIPIYPGKIPGTKPLPKDFKEVVEKRADGSVRISKAVTPTLSVYLPKENPTGTAVIICPGGGYGLLSMDHEGFAVAEAFNKLGIAAFVLKYRLPNEELMVDKSFGPLQDIQQAMYVVRKNAAEYKIQADKIGVMGFSAGGHLAASMSVHYGDVKIDKKDVNLRPDFSILIYPVISFLESPHAGSAKNLVGTTPTAEQNEYFSNERNVTPTTPPTFIVHAMDDGGVPVQNSMAYAQALSKNKVKAEVHLYQAGGHGFGMNNKTTDDKWFERLENWLKMNKLL
ncbi:alpha/beta hydrolase [Pedobacter sp.]|uniref:alpha/beta hydrolase n=1 Tax=Pedobacter sp. TaxID=1411316 RepID=UPI003D7FAD55